MPILDVIPFGPLRVYLDSATGEVSHILDALSGADATGRYRPEYLAAARAFALRMAPAFSD